jgi:hypothetical protein
MDGCRKGTRVDRTLPSKGKVFVATPQPDPIWEIRLQGKKAAVSHLLSYKGMPSSDEMNNPPFPC